MQLRLHGPSEALNASESSFDHESLTKSLNQLEKIHHLDFPKQKLHKRALEIAETYRRTEFELLEILKKIDAHRLYLDLGYSSLLNTRSNHSNSQRRVPLTSSQWQENLFKYLSLQRRLNLVG